ncbi:MAG: sugar phosphate isomerase/epimerase [Caldilineaceae bacterium]|nr:sugar phosphate isomerase/epimerase [Caldilineaceae bacterium]MDE0181876.1 sugar phosphate isomerase/epimerase [Caldilineaceae bacterium]
MDVAWSANDFPNQVLTRPEELIPRLKAAGITAIEAGYQFFVSHSEEEVEKNTQLFRQAGIQIWSVHAPFGRALGNLSDLDESNRRSAVEYNKYVLERIALAATSVYVIHPGSFAKEEEVPLMLRVLLDSLEEILPVAERSGVRLALENIIPRSPGSECQEVRDVVEKIGSEWLGVCYDSGHAHVAGQAKEGMEILKDLIITFHLEDTDGVRDMHFQPGYGTVPWDDVGAILRSMDFESPIVVEALPWQSDPVPWQGDKLGQMRREVTALLEGRMLKVDIDGMPSNVQCMHCGHLRYGTLEDSWCACP